MTQQVTAAATSRAIGHPHNSSGIISPDALIEEMNQQHAVVREGGKTIVITEEYDDVLERRVICRSTFEDIRKFYSNRFIGEGQNAHALGDQWLRHPDRRQYERVVFSPKQDVPRAYNLWRGFAFDPRPGDWSLLKTHISENVCCGNEEYYRYVMAWLAYGVQHPDRMPEVALALRGKQGVGKGMLGREYGRLFGQHFIHVAHGRHLTGNFNAHLQDAVVVFADEAFGADDKQAIAVLKMLITEPVIPIERKYRDVTFCKNATHLIIASNHDWVVPAGLEERRFFMLDVSDAHQQDRAYFKAIVAQMDTGGREAMLHELQHVDLSGIDVRVAPVTAALQEQKLYSMSPQQKWWFAKLVDHRLLPSHHVWHINIQRNELHEDYLNGPARGRWDQRATQVELGLFLKKVLPPGYPRRPRRVGRRLWVLPNLRECQEHFERLMKTTYTWP